MSESAELCPRCGDPIASEYYGPCAACRAGLKTTVKPPKASTDPDDRKHVKEVNKAMAARMKRLIGK